MKKVLFALLLSAITLSSFSASAKVLRGRCTVEAGKTSGLDALMEEADKIQTLDDDRYAEIIGDPNTAKTDVDALAALQAREVFILVDQSDSMKKKDFDPRGDHMKFGNSDTGDGSWTRWQSARTAAEGLAEVTLSLDKTHKVPLYFFYGDARTGKPIINKCYADNVDKITEAFDGKTPAGSTPLTAVLQKVYDEHLNKLLTKGEAFTVIVITDGAPDDRRSLIQYFVNMVETHHLTEGNRENLAAFSFIQIGDEDGASKFLKLLDDKLKPLLNVDIIDTKKDNYIFGTDPAYADDCGPLAVLRDAIFD